MIQEPFPQSTIVLDGQTISFIVKRSQRARYARLEIRPQTGLTVVIPRSYKTSQLPDLLRKKQRWILAKLARHSQPGLLPARTVKNGDTLPYLGRKLPVIILNHGQADTVSLERQKIVVTLKNSDSNLNPLLEFWYRRQAEKLITYKANELCPGLDVAFNRLRIRNARTRWGSCSPKGNLNFNWKLMMAPEPVIRYVVIHELAHLKEMNHTQRFWKLVAAHCPRWRQHRKWLKEHEFELAAILSG